MPRTKSPKKTNGDAAVAPLQAGVSSMTEANPSATAVTNTEAKKPTIVSSKPKIEGRANLVPINVEDEIRQLAYLMSERRGFEPGHEAEDWLLAEREVRERYHQQRA